MPEQFNNYYEPFLGSGAVMAQLLSQNSTTSTPRFAHSYASDILPFLIDIFNIVKYDPQQIKNYYSKEIEDYYKDPGEESEDNGLTEIIIAKHRNGATGEVNLAFEKNYSRFSDLAQMGPDGTSEGVRDLRS